MCQLLFCLPQLAECRFPTPFQFRADQTVLRVDLLVLPLRSAGRVTQALHLLTPGRENRGAACIDFAEVRADKSMAAGGAPRRTTAQLARQSASPQELTNWLTVLLSQVVTEVLRAPLVLHT